MSREEDLIRSTTRAIASTVREVPPLQLEPAADELRSPARAPRRARGGSRPRWWSWGAPLTAAALVVVLAIALVIIKDLPNGGAVPLSPATSTVGPDGAPRYFVALEDVPVKTKNPGSVFQFDIVVEDSLTGKTLATIAPPAHTTFQSVSAAADDRTFVVFAVSSATGTFGPSAKDTTLTGSWYKLRLAPGTANPARLSLLPITPWSWTELPSLNPTPGQIYATALSESGQELAVADIPDIPAASTKTGDWREVKVFSVATGRLLHDWTENNPTARLNTVLTDTLADVPVGTPDLTWIDGDRALALATSNDVASKVTGTIRQLNVATGPLSGSLMAGSTVIWSGTLPWSQPGECRDMGNWPPLINADDNTVSCVIIDMPEKTPGHLNFYTYPLPAGTAAGITPRLDYQATIPPEKQTGGIDTDILWVSPSADTLIVEWVPGGNLSPPKGAYFGVISQGKFMPLQIPKSFAASSVAEITF